MTQLSEKVKELIVKARIVSFATWDSTHPPDAIAIFQNADDQRRYLNDEELSFLQTTVPSHSKYIPVIQMLRDRVTEIVDQARGHVLQQFPNITEPGGGLYPPSRADACWRDFWHFLRCITYGIAGQHTVYTSSVGLDYMKQLYQELQVPLDAMIVGLEGIKTASLQRCEAEQQAVLAPYFDHLISQMKTFLK